MLVYLSDEQRSQAGLISASVLLAFDLLAERRGARYLQSLTFHERST